MKKMISQVGKGSIKNIDNNPELAPPFHHSIRKYSQFQTTYHYTPKIKICQAQTRILA
jgi:hypothetical protein